MTEQRAPGTPGQANKPSVPLTKKTIVLDYPVDFAGEHYTQLVVRRLKAKDFRQLDMTTEGGNAASIAMTALICGVDEAVIDELDAVDFLKIQEAVADFFPQALVDRLQARVGGFTRTLSPRSA